MADGLMLGLLLSAAEWYRLLLEFTIIVTGIRVVVQNVGLHWLALQL